MLSFSLLKYIIINNNKAVITRYYYQSTCPEEETLAQSNATDRVTKYSSRSKA